MSLKTGQILNNRYRIVSLLGEGGFGAVYRVWDLHMECPRALKENLDITPESQQQFKRESQILDSITHPNLPKVIDHFVLDGIGQYLVMEFIEGEDLKEKINNQEGPLLEKDVLPWIIQICDALAFLHQQDPPIIHRDIKPANIKITPQGMAVLVDFGIAKIYDPVLRTTVGARAVTPGYSPPEQYGQGKTDPRTDIYALGATLYTLLTGIIPPDSIDRMTGREQPPVPIRDVNSGVSLPVERAINRSMQLNERDRFETTTEFKAALRDTETFQVTTPGKTQLSTKKLTRPKLESPPDKKKHRWIPWVFGFVVFGVILFLAYLGINHLITPESEPFEKTTQIFPKDQAGMGYVPGGSFEMGSETGYENEQPVHKVSVPSFWMDQTEVTNRMYLACVEDGICQPPGDTEYIFDPFYKDYPVNYVSWEDAQEYCAWAGRELPSEAMWERASRGGLIGKAFPWGDQIPVCNGGESNGAQFADCETAPVPVKTYQDNGYGLYDMAGNLWEWVADIYEPYPRGNPTADEDYEKGYRVVRGGSFYDGLSDMGNAVRMGVDPNERTDYIGFRCVFLP